MARKPKQHESDILAVGEALRWHPTPKPTQGAQSDWVSQVVAQEQQSITATLTEGKLDLDVPSGDRKVAIRRLVDALLDELVNS